MGVPYDHCGAALALPSSSAIADTAPCLLPSPSPCCSIGMSRTCICTCTPRPLPLVRRSTGGHLRGEQRILWSPRRLHLPGLDGVPGLVRRLVRTWERGRSRLFSDAQRLLQRVRLLIAHKGMPGRLSSAGCSDASLTHAASTPPTPGPCKVTTSWAPRCCFNANPVPTAPTRWGSAPATGPRG